MTGAAPADGGGWDCHLHLFGPYDRYPLAAARSYTPPEAPLAACEAMLQALGLAHAVLVHPSAYGSDFSLLQDTLARRPGWRGVLVLQAGSPPALGALRARGLRGARFSHRSGVAANFAGSAGLEDLWALAPRLADAGLHAELWTDCAALPAIAPALRRLPVPLVIDHMGGFDPRAGIDDPGFRSLLSLLETGRTWVKMCAYRNLLVAPDPGAGRAFHRALLAAHPQRLVWGSDWPHLRVEPRPSTPALLETFRRWTGDARLAEQVLVHNPAVLYG